MPLQHGCDVITSILNRHRIMVPFARACLFDAGPPCTHSGHVQFEMPATAFLVIFKHSG